MTEAQRASSAGGYVKHGGLVQKCEYCIFSGDLATQEEAKAILSDMEIPHDEK